MQSAFSFLSWFSFSMFFKYKPSDRMEANVIHTHMCEYKQKFAQYFKIKSHLVIIKGTYKNLKFP